MLSVLIGYALIVCIVVLIFALVLLNPYRYQLDKLVNDHQETLHFGAFVDVYDLSANEHQIERLFIINPENVVLYNVQDAVFYYLESGSVLCPREFAVVKFTRDNIKVINESGIFDTICTNVNSLVLVEHFITLKEGVPDHRLLLSVEEINYSIMDLINYLIYTGYVKLG
ncbi:ORF102 [Leucania separata nucleopolyhedrovirus]|uniref:ORF102 n=1 Tax=Leucania separata nucleopolyhedrovirus TaxID=1307956 RepID=Q0IL17_NPVLS|nr:ORF102 [Leucania separata nucleopolyhedrovirus]AAR28866.1 ORF102 [Leucania separata nucleopolyhedrovirus]